MRCCRRRVKRKLLQSCQLCCFCRFRATLPELPLLHQSPSISDQIGRHFLAFIRRLLFSVFMRHLSARPKTAFAAAGGAAARVRVPLPMRRATPAPPVLRFHVIDYRQHDCSFTFFSAPARTAAVLKRKRGSMLCLFRQRATRFYLFFVMAPNGRKIRAFIFLPLFFAALSFHARFAADFSCAIRRRRFDRISVISPDTEYSNEQS